MTRRKLRVSIIGAGRMGTALGRALRREGHRIEVVVTNHAGTARRAAASIGGGALAGTDRQLRNSSGDLLNRLFKTDLLLISTPDDVLEPVAKQLGALMGPRSKTRGGATRIALHTSGALSSAVLEPLRTAGFAAASLHPLVSVAGAIEANNFFSGVHFCVEGDPRGQQLARSLVKDLGGHHFTISSEAKPLYHAAAALSSGHVVALFDVAIEMLEKCGLSKRRAQEILAPLLSSTLTNLASKPPAHSLTGPLSRGDLATVRRHLGAIRAKKLTEAATVYSVLGRRALKLAQTRGTSAQRLNAIARLLS